MREDCVTKSERNGVTKSERNGVTKSERNGVTKSERNGVTIVREDCVTKSERNGVTKNERRRFNFTVSIFAEGNITRMMSPLSLSPSPSLCLSLSSLPHQIRN